MPSQLAGKKYIFNSQIPFRTFHGTDKNENPKNALEINFPICFNWDTSMKARDREWKDMFGNTKIFKMRVFL